MPHKQQLSEDQKALMEKAAKAGFLSKVSKPAITGADIERQARNRRKAASKNPLTIISLPGRAGNPKKNKHVRRERPQDYRNKPGVYIPYVLLNHYQFATINSVNRVFLGGTKEQEKINDGLIKRAHIARRKGGYHFFQKSNRGEK